jgi:hypothetical protein
MEPALRDAQIFHAVHSLIKFDCNVLLIGFFLSPIEVPRRLRGKSSTCKEKVICIRSLTPGQGPGQAP